MRPLALVLAMACMSSVAAQEKDPPPPATPPAIDSYFVESRGYGTAKEPEPPRYVRRADRTGIDAFEKVDWLDLGLELRLRYEHRSNDYRRQVAAGDDVLLERARIYLGVRKQFDPVRFVVELTDARRLGGQYPRDDRDVNVTEPIQAFGELYFANGAGQRRPLGVRDRAPGIRVHGSPAACQKRVA